MNFHLAMTLTAFLLLGGALFGTKPGTTPFFLLILVALLFGLAAVL